MESWIQETTWIAQVKRAKGIFKFEQVFQTKMLAAQETFLGPAFWFDNVKKTREVKKFQDTREISFITTGAGGLLNWAKFPASFNDMSPMYTQSLYGETIYE